MELKLVSDVFTCNQESRSRRLYPDRRLQLDGVSGLDYMPLDAKNEDIVCFSGSNSTSPIICETYFGRMFMYLQSDTDKNMALIDMLYSIQNTMQKKDFPSIDAITRVWYIEPELKEASGISDGSDLMPDNSTSVDNSFSAGALTAFAALGVFVFAALALGIFRMRRSPPSGISTIEHTSRITTYSNSQFESRHSTFSSMLPTSLRLDDTMSAIIEGDSDSEKCQGSVIVSEGGYTSDGDSQHHTMNVMFHSNLEPVLGAQKIDDDNLDIDRDLLFDNDDALAAKDVKKCNSVNCSNCIDTKQIKFIASPRHDMVSSDLYSGDAALNSPPFHFA